MTDNNSTEDKDGLNAFDIKAAYIKGYIDAEAAKKRLIGLGMSEAEAEMLLHG